ncbi:MAG: flagellin [Bacteriovoracales bacterium]|nr:flagellin [Bacteriovoracales bacterium]
MSYRINTNVSAMVAQRSLSRTNKEQGVTFNRLSTGSRITKSSDDSAGLAISEKLRSHIRSSTQAVRNTADGISMLQVAEGGLNELTNILIRLRELAIQASSDTLADVEREFTDVEFQNLVEEIDRITAVTEFNGRKLLDGTGDVYDIQVGIKNDDFEDRISFNAGESNVKASSLGIDGLGVSKKADAHGSLDKIDTAITKVTGTRANLGAIQNRLSSATENLRISIENQSFARSRIADTDYALESSNNVRYSILSQAGTAVLAQANTRGQWALQLLGG